MTEVLRQPHFINSKLLEALRGTTIVHVVQGKVFNLADNGANVWGVEDTEKGKGVLNHVLKTSRVAYYLGKDLKEEGGEFKDMDLQLLVHAAILHDITKLYGEDRERLPIEFKRKLGLADDFREISEEVDATGVSWLRALAFPKEVCQTILGHDFPERIVDDPYWKIVLVADYMTGQNVMTVNERLDDVKKRWITDMVEKGEQPRINPKRFDLAEKNIKQVSSELFERLGESDSTFITRNNLNSEESQARWERFLQKTREMEKAEKASSLVRVLIG